MLSAISQLNKIAKALSLERDYKQTLNQQCFDRVFTLCEQEAWEVLDPLTPHLSILVDDIGHTLLMKAAIQQKSHIVKPLIKKEIGIGTADDKGKNPLDYLFFGAASHANLHYYSRLIINKIGLSHIVQKLQKMDGFSGGTYNDKNMFSRLKKFQDCDGLTLDEKRFIIRSGRFFAEGALRQALFEVLLEGKNPPLTDIKFLKGVLKVQANVFEYFDQCTLQCMWLLQKRLAQIRDESTIEEKEKYEACFYRLMGFKPSILEEDVDVLIETLQHHLKEGNIEDSVVDRFLKACPTYCVIYSKQIEIIKCLLGIMQRYYRFANKPKIIDVINTRLLLPGEAQPTPEDLVQLYSSLAMAYCSMGQIANAEHYLEIASQIYKEKIDNERHPSVMFISLVRGYLYSLIGLPEKAKIEMRRAFFFKEALQFNDVGISESTQNVLVNFIHSFEFLITDKSKDIEKKWDVFDGRLAIDTFKEFYTNDPTIINALYSFLDQELDQEKTFKIFKSLQDMLIKSDSPAKSGGLLIIDRTFSDIFFKQKAFEKALDLSMHLYHQLVNEDGDLTILAVTTTKIGACYFEQGDFENAARYSREACDYLAILQMELRYDEWRITFFNQHIGVHLRLEQALIKMAKMIEVPDARARLMTEALEVSDARRACALCKMLSERINEVKPGQTERIDKIEPGGMTLKKMHEVARQCNTTLVVYSTQGFCYVIDKKPERLQRFLPAGEVIPICPIDVSKVSFQSVDSFISGFPYRGIEDDSEIASPSIAECGASSEVRGLTPQELYAMIKREEKEKKREKFHTQLKEWYQVFIAPIEKFLPEDPSETVTFILDGQMPLLPFAIFEKTDEHYFIKDHPFLVAPSIKALSLLAELREKRKGRAPLPSLVIGNPTLKNSERDLPYAKKEGEAIATLLGTPSTRCLLGKAATVESTLALLNSSGWIHIACHGDDKVTSKIDALYKGALCLAQDESDGVSESKGEDNSQGNEAMLFADAISERKLEAEFAFLSACYSGRGNIGYMNEGIIGMTRAFLSGGTLTTASTLWTLPDSEATVKMIDQFYSYLLGKKDGIRWNKALALQKAMLEIMKDEEQRKAPDLWGGIFLTGLD